MFLNDVQNWIRRFVPRPVSEAIRAVATAVLTPVHFSARSGHFRSSVARKAVDRNGNPIPWYTYPAIDFLAAKDFAGRSVLEFGAGQSTLWWGARAATVTSIESDQAWFDDVSRVALGNTKLHLSPNDLSGMGGALEGALFDIVIVDGLDRLPASHMATNCLLPDGCVIFDNSDAYSAPDGSDPILDHFRSLGFSRVDFYGHAPGVVLHQCTSILFRESCFLLRGTENPNRTTPSFLL